ncbi:MAG: glycosyltransferase [Stenotrophomonas sp.]
MSVIIPTWNHSRFLQQCVQSVLDQGIDDIEILVLDNASTDETPEVMNSFAADQRVRYMRNRYNYGPGFNWGNGLMIATGKYLTFLSADDYFKPDHLASLLPILQAHPEVAVGYTGIDWIDGQNQPLNQPRHSGYAPSDYVGGRNEVVDLLIHDNYMTPSAVVYRRQALCATWRPVSNKGGGDWDMAIQMAEQFPDFAYIDTPGVCYRWHGAQYSQQSFYNSLAPLQDHLSIVDGVFERGAQGRLKGRENEVSEHIERRLALYPTERASPLGERARALMQRLHLLAEEHAAPLFSIIVTTWNRPTLLVDTLASIQAQTFRDFEVVLVNDCGEPVEHLLGKHDVPLHYLRLGRNGGPATARNAAHRLARGRYLVYLDDDDLFLPEHLKTLAEALQEHPGEVVYTDALFITERIEDGHRHALAEERRYPHDRYSHARLSVDNYIPVNTFAWPCALADEVGDFDERLSGLEDWDFLLRLAARVPFHHVRRETVQVRMRAENDERRSLQALEEYPVLYQKLYARHSDLGDESVRIGRAERLKQLGVLAPQTQEAIIDNWRAVRMPTPAQRQLVEQHLHDIGKPPRLCLLLRATDGDMAALSRTLQSLGTDEAPYPVPHIIVLASSALEQAHTSITGHPAHVLAWDAANPVATINTIITESEADYLLFADAGDEFTPGGLLRLHLELAAQPQLRALYADEWYRDDAGVLAPTLRPDLNLDLLLGNPAMLSGHWVFRRQTLLEAGGFDPEAGSAAELDLILRLVQQGGFDGIAHLPEPLLTCAPPRFDAQAQQNVITRHLHARGYANAAVEGIGSDLYRIDYGHSQQPPVSLMVIVSANTALASLERCVISLLEKTGYPNHELLLIDNGAAAEVSQWMQQVETLAAGRVRAFAFDPPLAHAAACNVAATQAAGDYLLFLRPEVTALQPQWLDELLNHGLRPEVGIVGGKTISADGKVTHAGLVPGLTSSGGRAFAGLPMDAPGYMSRLQVAQSYSAVADSCLLIDKTLFMELDGFDHAAFADEGADVDLCLRARQRGYLTIWTPHALLLHSVEAVPLPEAANDALLERWLPTLAHDPAYNPSLRLDVPGGFRLGESDFSWQPLPWRPIPRVLAHPADPWGSGHYRVIQPFEALKAAGQAEGALYATLLDTVEQARIDPDVVVLQRRVADEELERMRRMPRFSHALKVFELDDYLPNLPAKNIHREHMPRDILRGLRRAFGLVDRVVVSTPALAEAFAGMHPDIRIARNRLPPLWWKGLPAPRRNAGARPRVGWAGGLGHAGDLELIAGVISELAGEVDWVFFGMCPEPLQPYVAELHPGVDITLYPRMLARLNLDLAIAPLEQNRFNECKSNLRLLEYGACALPVVCSDVGPYRGDELPVTRVRNRHRDWVGAIRSHLADADARAAAGDALRAVVQRDWMLAGTGLNEWRAAWLP